MNLASNLPPPEQPWWEALALHGSGNARAEEAAAGSSCVLCVPRGAAIVRVRGEDAQAFLNAQLTCEVPSPGGAGYGAWLSAKGRVLATLDVWSDAQGYLLQVPASEADLLIARLSRYVLRSRVRIERADAGLALLGLAGPGCASALQAALGLELPATAAPTQFEAAAVVVLHLPGPRIELVAPAATGQALWERLRSHARPADAALWDAAGLRAGFVRITGAVADQFVPQMLNLERVGAVSFTKGCYPGQEIVARAQYRGEVKRRVAGFLHQGAAYPGQAVYSRLEPEALGTVVDCSPLAPGRALVLACVPVTADRRELSLEPDGPLLEAVALPTDRAP